MTDVPTRKQLGLIDYNNIPSEYIYIGRIPSPLSSPKINYEIIDDIFVGDGLLIDRKESRNNGVSDGAENQFEMPLAAVGWMIDAIEQGFEKPPSAGGITKNTLHTDTRINDERLRVMYGVSVGGEGVGGYTIVNPSRSGYILPRYSQQFSITVDIWNKFGRAFFKTLQKRIDAGEFN